MKSIFKVSLLAATVVLAVGCQKEESSKAASATQAPAATEQAKVHFKSDDDKAAYAIGVSFANYLGESIEKPNELGIKLSKDEVLKGIEDTFAGKAGLNQEETRQALESLDQRVAKKMKAKEAEQAAAALKAGDEFRAKFAKEEGVKETKSGLLYKVITPGKGEKPSATDVVEVNYTGKLIDGTKFDSSYDRGKPATFPLDRVIPGWTEGLQLMPAGSKFEFVIPPKLAYGDHATPTIPANSTLVFDVELIKVEHAKKAEAPHAHAKPAAKTK